MNKRPLILISLTLAVFGLPGRVLVDGQPAEKVIPPRGPETVTITLLEPTSERPPGSARPTFQWSTETSAAGLTYDFVLREITAEALKKEDATALDRGPVVFERKGIRGIEVAYPESSAPLDKTKVYAWAAVAHDSQGRQVGQATTVIGFPNMPLGFCILWLNSPASYAVCQSLTGNFTASISWSMFNSSGGSATWTLTDPNGSQSSGSAGTIPISWTGTAPGVYQWTLTVTKGNCTRTRTITLTVYPSFQVQILDYPSGIAMTDICWGDDATLKMVDVSGNPLPSGCPVSWDYSANGGSTWIPLGQGNPINTNPIINTNPLFSGLSCTAGQNSITLQFRGTLPNCPNFPPAGASACPILTAPLTVWCLPQAGTITINGSNPQICNSSSSYPLPVTLNLNGQLGTVDYWTVNGGSPIPGSQLQTTITYPIPSAGTYYFCAFVHNGSCVVPVHTCQQIIVEDPIQGAIQVTQNGVPNPNPEVCWGDDKVTMTFVPTKPLPAGTTFSWEYDINCTGSWSSTGTGTGITQNSNDLILSPFYPAGVNSCLVDKVCWRVKADSHSGICLPSYISVNQANTPVTIHVIKPFDHTNPPVISPSQPAVKCPGQSVPLTVSNPACATGPFTYQWYLNGLPISIAGATTPSINAVDPGNYTVIVCNKNHCDCIETAPVTVRDCVTVVKITGPCACKAGQGITLTANASSQVVPSGGSSSNCGGPYTYTWSTGAQTQSITIPCPSATTNYWVDVKDAMFCTTRANYSVKRCP